MKPRLKQLTRLSICKSETWNNFKADTNLTSDEYESALSGTVDHIIDPPYNTSFEGSGGVIAMLEPHVTSFCYVDGEFAEYEKCNGLLSQWRGYGAESGYAIEFDTQRLNALVVQEEDNFHYGWKAFDEVIYDRGVDDLATKFPLLVNAIELNAPKILKQEYESVPLLFGPLVDAATRFKHPGFREENEVRMVFSPISQEVLERHHENDATSGDRERHKQTKTPHFSESNKQFIKLFDSGGEKLPIRKIIVGPHKDKIQRKENLLRFLRGNRIDIEVVCSETPLLY